ncbi:MAG: hypothetical protein JSS40_04985 [Proteobacteria bacterium]|nr:hypothetical protein [Pseudomonadota bacterium]
MYAYSQAIAALGLEAAGFWALMGLGGDLRALAAFLLAHAGASALAALVLVASLPGPTRRQPGWASAFYFVMCFFIPVLGVPGLLATALVGRVFPKRGAKEVFSTAAAPEFAPHDDRAAPAESPHAHGPVRAQLTDPASPVETRMRALLTIQDLPSRVANPIIRNMLADPSDDVRLVAYGILDSREKRINARIQAARAHLEGDDPNSRLPAEKELAELYWELVYQGLVQGDLQKHAAAQSRAHFDAALKLAPEDAALWALGGRLANFAGQYERAWHAFTRAMEFGMPEVRALPYLAEVAFRMRRFDRVRQMLERIAQTSHTQRMAQVIDYWNANGRAAG